MKKSTLALAVTVGVLAQQASAAGFWKTVKRPSVLVPCILTTISAKALLTTTVRRPLA